MRIKVIRHTTTNAMKCVSGRSGHPRSNVMAWEKESRPEALFAIGYYFRFPQLLLRWKVSVQPKHMMWIAYSILVLLLVGNLQIAPSALCSIIVSGDKMWMERVFKLVSLECYLRTYMRTRIVFSSNICYAVELHPEKQEVNTHKTACRFKIYNKNTK